MPFLRPAGLFRPSATLRPTYLAAPRAVYPAQVRFATQDYGSPDGDPAAEKGHEQGQNPSEHLEHPGPEKPSAAQKGNESSSSSSTSSSKNTPSSGQSQQGQQGSKKGAQPKILGENPPPSEHDESVKQHNADMDRRAERAHEGFGRGKGNEKDQKVDKKFWSGQGGRDSDP